MRQLTIDDYEIKNKLGEGAFGKVYMCIDKATNKEVAIKMLSKIFLAKTGKV